VINDTTYYTILVLKILLKLESGPIDIETAFLFGDLEEKLCMDFPDGCMEYIQELEANGKIQEITISDGTSIHQINEKDYCCEIKKTMYGIFQATHQW
jgi:hypothetical protein